MKPTANARRTSHCPSAKHSNAGSALRMTKKEAKCKCESPARQRQNMGPEPRGFAPIRETPDNLTRGRRCLVGEIAIAAHRVAPAGGDCLLLGRVEPVLVDAKIPRARILEILQQLRFHMLEFA